MYCLYKCDTYYNYAYEVPCLMVEGQNVHEREIRRGEVREGPHANPLSRVTQKAALEV